MILFSKKGTIVTIICAIYLLAISFIASNIYIYQGAYMLNVLSKNFFMLLLLPVFLILSAVIDSSISFTLITRLKNRKYAVFFELIQQYLLAFIFLCFHGAALVIISICRYGSQVDLGIVFTAKKLLLYFWGLLIAANLSYIIKRCNIKNISSASYILVCCFVITEIEVVHRINMFFNNIYLIFSWTERTIGIIPIIAMGIEFIISTVVVFKVSSKADIL